MLAFAPPYILTTFQIESLDNVSVTNSGDETETEIVGTSDAEEEELEIN
jgi:hypothetical protein